MCESNELLQKNVHFEISFSLTQYGETEKENQQFMSQFFLPAKNRPQHFNLSPLKETKRLNIEASLDHEFEKSSKVKIAFNDF
jgi:hypothetical protein